MILSKEVNVYCRNNTYKHYEDLGYNIPRKLNKKNKLILDEDKCILVNIKDLPTKSNLYILVSCDYCLKEGVETISSKQYYTVTISHKIIDKDCCQKCVQKKQKEINFIKYGDNLSPNRIKSVKRSKKPFADVVKSFDELNFKLLANPEDYTNAETKLPFECNLHKGVIQYKSYKDTLDSTGCQMCNNENKRRHTGENSNNWKGGICSLSVYLRSKILPWRDDSLKYFDYKCCLSGEKLHLEVHHVYNFNMIVQEVLDFFEYPIYEETGKYSDKQLHNMANKCLELHYKYGYGVVVTKEIHNIYHSVYGREDGNFAQFKEFASKYYGISFLTDLTVVNVAMPKVNISKYYPFKTNTTSKYYGIYKDKYNNFRYKITLNYKEYIKRTYKDELECVYDLNQIILSVKGSSATTNYLTDEQIEYVKKLKLEKAS